MALLGIVDGTTADIESPEYPLSIETITSTIKSDYDAGYTITRRKFTRTPKRFTLKWAMLSGADYALLDAHFQAAGGAAASWIFDHPLSTATPTVRYKDDVLKFDLITPGPESGTGTDDGGYYSGSVILEEV